MEIKENPIDWEKIESSKVKRVSTSVKISLLEEIQQRGWKISELIRLGVMAKFDNPQLINRIKVLEKEISKKMDNILEILRRLAQDKYLGELEEKLKKSF